MRHNKTADIVNKAKKLCNFETFITYKVIFIKHWLNDV